MSKSRSIGRIRPVFLWFAPLVLVAGVARPDPALGQGQVAALETITELPAREDGFRSSPRPMQPAKPLEIPDRLWIEEPYAWNRTDRYAPPDFEAFFPDDPEGGKQLDALFGGQLGGNHTPEEVFAVVRRGLRNTKRHPTLILAEVGKSFVWGVKDQDPRAIELLYHASDWSKADAAHSALYHGLTVVKQRSDNLLRTLIERYATYDGEIQGRILWGFKTYGDRDDTAARLKRLLDHPAGLDDNAMVAAVDLYREFTGQAYPDLAKFNTAGMFAIAFEAKGLTTVDQLRSRMAGWAGDGSAVVEFVLRIDDGKPVGVGLVRGISHRERILKAIEGSDQATLVFCETLAPAVLQHRQLREFAKYLPDGLPNRARPVYAAPPADEKFAWNATDGYVPPDFFGYFPDDPQAGAELDAIYKDYGFDTQDFTAREILEKIRRGLRHSKLPSQQLMSWAGQLCGWPADPMAREIAYHAADPRADQKMRHNAVYFGLRGWWNKTPNVLRLFGEILAGEPHDRSIGHSTRGDILWSLREEEEKGIVATYLATALEKHADCSVEQLADMTEAYQQLTDKKPPNYADYSSRGRFVILFGDSQSNTPEALRQKAQGNFGSDPRWLQVNAWQEKSEPQALAVVQGLEGMEWAVSALQAAKFVPYAACSIADLDAEAVKKYGLEKYRTEAR